MSTQQIWTPYCGAAPLPAEWLARWNLDPVLLVLLAALPFAYRYVAPGAAAPRKAAFAGAFALLLLLFVSPFCALSSALFSVRVVHHVLLGAVVAPLLVYALPKPPRLAGSLAAWTFVQALVFWGWHSPGLYAFALSSDLAYWLMQTSLLGTAFAFWVAIRRAAAPTAAAALLASMVQMGLLGALITFSGAALYAPHYLTTSAWGYAPLEDQQVAGLIMWAPAAALYLLAALALTARWFGREERLSSAA